VAVFVAVLSLIFARVLDRLRALARLATHGGEEQAHIVHSGGLEFAVKCMTDNMSSAAIQQAGCVLMVNLARQSVAAGHIDKDGYPIDQRKTEGYHMLRSPDVHQVRNVLPFV